MHMHNGFNVFKHLFHTIGQVFEVVVKCKSCLGCDGGNTVKFNSRKRKRPKAIVITPDGARPFGAMSNLDHIAMEPKSEAAKAALYSLNIQDEQLSFCMAYPSNCREARTIVDASHSFDDGKPIVKRWWTDAAPEFAKAARTIKSLRQLAH